MEREVARFSLSADDQIAGNPDRPPYGLSSNRRAEGVSDLALSVTQQMPDTRWRRIPDNC